ncbi:hypothetical protein VQ097_002439 [Enterobacter hormaechei]|jgi:hypothetical protein|uniref:hypothetical protein n=1 Tax=Enterobacter hormaechei TaxID=158836 RepID=UPI00092F3350|nr:hypothetical protein [Enterobacter hormaechei]EKY3889423.1 hypothetical protein [Enterobacter hormaechei]EKY3938071.1 hypothetical protein [Enterobacter hormaechei]EKY4149785.1 hypothetical protein [Enterobacter hormaechei subsp. steigerwaltii]EMD2740601.1 hypothetical protein [Enterobacter hormaechei]MBG0525282.1 hypothetical protein [Enterobacter hormaechei]
MIAYLRFIRENNALEWIHCSRNISLNIPRLDIAMVDPTRQLVFALSEPKSLPTVLTIFNAHGEKIFWSAPPEGATFYYLTFNLSNEVVVVCSYPVKQNGLHDWFYSYDMKRNALSRSGPAY